MNRHAILKAELVLSHYSGKTDAECLELLNDKDITVMQDVTAHDIQKYLMLARRWMSIKNSILPSADKTREAMRLFPTFTMGDPLVYNELNSALDGLIADSFIDENNKAIILTMGERMINRADQLGLGVIGLGLVEGAR